MSKLQNMSRNMSRSRIYDLMVGQKKIATGGATASGSIQFADIPVAGETVTIGGYVFEAQAGASESAGTSAGSVADPHLFQSITNLATAGASLAAQVLAETATTGAWGYLHPDDSDGCVFSTDTLTLTFWPGTAGNAITLAGSATDETIVQPVTASNGVEPPVISLSHKTTVIDTTGSAANEEYYILPDGQWTGQEVTIIIETLAASDTPSLLGNFWLTAAFVQCQFNVDAEFVRLIWSGTYWKPMDLIGEVSYTASA